MPLEEIVCCNVLRSFRENGANNREDLVGRSHFTRKYGISLYFMEQRFNFRRGASIPFAIKVLTSLKTSGFWKIRRGEQSRQLRDLDLSHTVTMSAKCPKILEDEQSAASSAIMLCKWNGWQTALNASILARHLDLFNYARSSYRVQIVLSCNLMLIKCKVRRSK